MASTSMEETPNWLEMPQDLMRMILQRLGAVEILNSAQKVCTTWRRICKDPAMWKVIDMRGSLFDLQGSLFDLQKDYDLEKLAKQAVHRSRGELIDISIVCFGSDNLLDYISRCSSKLNRLCLVTCYDITSSGLSQAIKRLPHLEKLHLFYIYINVEDIEVIGRSCSMLKSFKMNKGFRQTHIEGDGDALAIANNMLELRHLQLFGNEMTNNGLQAILHGCPHLESLDLRRCFNLDLDGNLGKLCMERIKDLKLPDLQDDYDYDFPEDDYDYDYDYDFPEDNYDYDSPEDGFNEYYYDYGYYI